MVFFFGTGAGSAFITEIFFFVVFFLEDCFLPIFFFEIFFLEDFFLLTFFFEAFFFEVFFLLTCLPVFFLGLFFLGVFFFEAFFLETFFLLTALRTAFFLLPRLADFLETFFRAAMLSSLLLPLERAPTKWRIIHSESVLGSAQIGGTGKGLRGPVSGQFRVWHWGRQNLRDGRRPVSGAMFRNDGGVNTPPHIEPRGQSGVAGCQRRYQVTQNGIGDCLVKCAFIAKGPDVLFEGFKFHTAVFGYIVEKQDCEIRLTGLGAQTCEFRDPNPDAIIAPRVRVVEGFQFPAEGTCCGFMILRIHQVCVPGLACAVYEC